MSEHEEIHVRLDFIFKEIKENPDGTFEVVSIPDPQRYDRIKRKGKWLLVDRFTKVAFDEEKIMAQVARDFMNLPVRYQPAKIGDQDAWLRGRAEAIAALLEGEGRPGQPGGRSHEELLSSLESDHPFAFVTVIVKNLAKLAQLSNADRATLTSTLAHELALAADLHYGSLWRSSQGGHSFFFPAPNLITKVDLSLSFATVARDLVHLMNRFLTARGWPTVAVSIGIEAGAAFPHITGLPEHYSAVDLAGIAVALSEEIARAGSAGDVLVGPNAAQLAHSSWQQLLKPMEPQPQVQFPDNLNSVVYRLASDARSSGALITGGPGP